MSSLSGRIFEAILDHTEADLYALTESSGTYTWLYEYPCAVIEDNVGGCTARHTTSYNGLPLFFVIRLFIDVVVEGSISSPVIFAPQIQLSPKVLHPSFILMTSSEELLKAFLPTDTMLCGNVISFIPLLMKSFPNDVTDVNKVNS